MNKNKMAAKHIEDELHNAARNIAGEVNIMLDACEQAMLDKVLEIIDNEQENIGVSAYEALTNVYNKVVGLREVEE